jgi:hypothetical protein
MSQDLAFGFFDAGINELLRKYPAFVSGYDCLLTCMDSTAETAGALRRLFPTLSVMTIGSFAVVSGDFALQHREQLFTGFDEFYTFSPGALRGQSVELWKKHFTSDWVELRTSLPDGLRRAFVDSGALTYASDGCGLNVILRDSAVLKKLRLIMQSLGPEG